MSSNVSKPLKLDRMRQVSLRQVWSHEAYNFTNWLSKAENIELLAEAIELDGLTVENAEVPVGTFRADLVCTEEGTGKRVVIENQLEITDHDHLGKVLLYTAGLKASIVVWIAESFREEHRAALDWLNANTGEDFDFFGLQIELWQIGDSDVAPRFNIISKPNEWSKRRFEAAHEQGSQSEAKQLQLEFWQAFKLFVVEKSKILRPRKPRPQHWTTYAIGGSEFGLTAYVDTTKKVIRVSLVIRGENAKTYFKLLEKEKAQIESEIGDPLDWRELPDGIYSTIDLRLSADIAEKSQWSVQQTWLCTKLEAFHKAFAQRIKSLDIVADAALETVIDSVE